MFERLIKLIRREKVSLFIGSGFSLEANAPSARLLCEAVLSQIDDEKLREAHKDDSLADVSNFFVDNVCNGSRNSLIELLQEQFEFKPRKMDDHQTLARIPHFHNIFTTNYDTLLEDSYSKEDCQVIRKDADCAYLDNNKPVKVFKIHGDFINPDYVVITTKDYEDFFNNRVNPQMWDVVKHDFLTKNILFIGYSLEDDNVLQIIQTIRDSVGKNQKEVFLIAPTLSRDKENKLKKLGVKYFKAYASEFLSELTRELKKHIVNDYRHHEVSLEIFSKFCSLFNVSPTLSLREDQDNQISQLKSINGEDLHCKVEMKVGDIYKERLESMDFERYGVKVPNSPFPHVPFIRLEGSQLSNCSFTVNEIVMNDRFSAVLVGPTVNDFPMTIRIPSKNFIEKVVAKSYRPRKEKFVIDLDCHIYTLKVTIDNAKDMPCTKLTFEFKKTYTNNNEAIKWIDLLDALYSKEEVFIQEISDIPLNKGLCKESDSTYPIKECKEYFSNIKQIEILSGVSFDSYNCCTETNYRISCMVVSYLMHKPLVIHCPKGMQFTDEVKYDPDFVEYVNAGNKVTIVRTDDNPTEYLINGKPFIMPYTSSIFEQCSVNKVEKGGDGYMTIEFQNELDSYVLLFSDEHPDKMFSDLTILDCRDDLKQSKNVVP